MCPTGNDKAGGPPLQPDGCQEKTISKSNLFFCRMPRSSHQSPLLLQKLDEGYVRLGLSGARLLLAVSGGADSSALLVGTARRAAARRLACTVASVDHGLR